MSAPHRNRSAEEITLNFVVKDRKGVAIKNLDSSQIEVTDGGVKRQPAVRLIDGEQPERRERLFVLAFEPMALVDRRLAKAAMLRMLEDDGNQNHLFSVFVFSNQLALLQPFLRDSILNTIVFTYARKPLSIQFFYQLQPCPLFIRQCAEHLKENVRGSGVS